MADAPREGSIGGTQVREDRDGTKIQSHRQRLSVVQGPDRGLRLELERTRIRLGTGADNDLCLTDPSVSRHHFVIDCRAGRYLLRDLGSTNGTEVNGMSVTEAYLPPRALIRVGDTELRFEPRQKWERIAPSENERFGGVLGRSKAMRTIFGLLGRVAPTDLTCVLVGETGTGKELAARAIHEASPRAEQPFIVLDCASVQEALLAADLFGHERGAFTGAEERRLGAFERANGGTIFLDEIGELPSELQPRLLRVLQEREVRRLGSQEAVKVDVRIVAATHRDLPRMVAEGAFREDLWFRLAEIVVRLPPLRERREDLPLLVRRIVEDELVSRGRPPLIDDDTLTAIARHDWPGNVRELRNVLRRAVALADGPTLSVTDVEASLAQAHATSPEAPLLARELVEQLDVLEAEQMSLQDARARWRAPLEREYLRRLLREADGDVETAAAAAGIHRKSLERLLRQHGLDPHRPA